MAQFVKVGSRAEFEDLEAGKLVEAAGQIIAVFNVGGNYLCDREYMASSGWPSGRGNDGR